MAFGRVVFEDRLSCCMVQSNIPYLFCRWIAVSDSIVGINEDDPLLHGCKNGSQNGKIQHEFKSNTRTSSKSAGRRARPT